MRHAFISAIAAGALALAAASPVAAAGPRPMKPHIGYHGHHGHHGHHKPLRGGKASMGYVGYIPFCAATGLILSGIYVGHTQHRELTTDEALGILGTCVFPPLALFYLMQPAR